MNNEFYESYSHACRVSLWILRVGSITLNLGQVTKVYAPLLPLCTKLPTKDKVESFQCSI